MMQQRKRHGIAVAVMSLAALILALPSTAVARGERGERNTTVHEARARNESSAEYAGRHRRYDRFERRALRAANRDRRAHRRRYRLQRRHDIERFRREARHEFRWSLRVPQHAIYAPDHRAVQAAYYCRPCRTAFQSHERLRHHVSAQHHVPIWRLGYVLSPHGAGWWFFG